MAHRPSPHGIAAQIKSLALREGGVFREVRPDLLDGLSRDLAGALLEMPSPAELRDAIMRRAKTHPIILMSDEEMRRSPMTQPREVDVVDSDVLRQMTPQERLSHANGEPLPIRFRKRITSTPSPEDDYTPIK